MYGFICLLLASAAGAERSVVEGDEDIEFFMPDGRSYVQVKTCDGKLAAGDISGAIERFEEIREEHRKGARPGSPSFVIASNAAPNGPLETRIATSDWPEDAELHWPDRPEPTLSCLPRPPHALAAARSPCPEPAYPTPFALYRPANP